MIGPGEDEFLTTYSHEARKVVRWKGGYWMDQLGVTDFVGDDVFLFNAYPTWYADFKILAKKKVLVVANSVHPFWNPGGDGPAEQLPGIDLENAPHWNVRDAWEPREVFVIEARCKRDDLSPERILQAKQEASVAVEALKELSPRTRAAFVLIRFEGLSYKAAATRLGISVSAVEKHVTKALRVVSTRLQETDERRSPIRRTFR